MNIKNPSCVKSISDIKSEFVQTADCILSKFTYPNGFVLITEQHFDETKISTNRPLIKIDENTYQIPD